MGILSRKKATPAPQAQPQHPAAAPPTISAPISIAPPPVAVAAIDQDKQNPTQTSPPGVTATALPAQNVLPSPPRSPVLAGCESSARTQCTDTTRDHADPKSPAPLQTQTTAGQARPTLNRPSRLGMRVSTTRLRTTADTTSRARQAT